MAALNKAAHERFAQLLAQGRKQADAYIGAGHKISRHGASVNGSRLAKRPEIKARVAELLATTAAASIEAVDELASEIARALVDVAPNEAERARRITWLLREGRRAINDPTITPRAPATAA
jgi:phage terminase small subunit